MAVWGQRRYIVVPLIVILLGHWSLLLQGEYRPRVSYFAFHLTYRCRRSHDEGQMGPGCWMCRDRDQSQANIRYIHLCDVRRLHSAVPDGV